MTRGPVGSRHKRSRSPDRMIFREGCGVDLWSLQIGEAKENLPMPVASTRLQSLKLRFTIQSPFRALCRPRRCTPMTSPGSITHWLDQLRSGDAAAAQHLWQGYFCRLVSLAHQKLRSAPRGMADEEDVAMSAFDSFL